MTFHVCYDRPLQLTYETQDVNVSAVDQTGVMYAKRVRILLMDAYKLTGGKDRLLMELVPGSEAKPLKIDFGRLCTVTLRYFNGTGEEEQTTLDVTCLTLLPSQGTLIAEGQTSDVQMEAPQEHTCGSSAASYVPPVQPPLPVQTQVPVQPPAPVQTQAPVQPPAPVQTQAPVQPPATSMQAPMEQLLLLKEEQLFHYLIDHRNQLNHQMASIADEIEALKTETDQLEMEIGMRQREMENVQQRLEARRSVMSSLDAQILVLVEAESKRQAAVKCMTDFDHAAFAVRLMEQQEMIEVRRKAARLYGSDASPVLDSVPDCLKQAGELVAQADEVLSKFITTREEINRIIVSALDQGGCVEAKKLKGGDQHGLV